MKVHLNQIAAGPSDHHLHWRPRALPRLAEMLAEGESGDAGEIRADLVLKLVEGSVEARGHVRAVVNVPCARCLMPVELELSEPFVAVQVPSAREYGLGSEVELTGYALDVDFFEGDEIDLDALAEEQVLLAIPPNETCRDDCKGLCVQCGQNLNEGACGCPPEKAGHPFAALKTLLNDGSR